MRCVQTLHVFIIMWSFSCDCAKKIPLGALFDVEDINQQLLFDAAIHEINLQHDELHLESATAHLPLHSSLLVARALCPLLEKGLVGLVGPSSSYTSDYAQSLCDLKDLPHLETHWDATLKRGNTLLNLHPYSPRLLDAYIDMVRNWGWTSFTILYEDNESLMRVSDLLRMYRKSEYTIALRQIDMENSGNYRPLLMALRQSGAKHFIIDCRISMLEEVFKQAQQVGLMTEQYNFIVLNLDMCTMDLSPYQYGGTNITGLRLVNPENPLVKKFATKLQRLHTVHKLSNEPTDPFTASQFSTQLALLVDAVFLLNASLHNFAFDRNLIKPLQCHDDDTCMQGLSIINDMRTRSLKGLTGNLKFDTEGFRSDFSVDVVELSTDGLVTVGEWSTTFGLNMSRPPIVEELEIDESTLKHKNFIVITALTAPYSMLKPASLVQIGNARYEGFAIDLIQELSQMLGFNYTFVVQDDGDNGSYNETTGQWSGIIGEILNGNADLAITDLTITYDREEIVDFTMPFMTLGISILYRKAEPVPPSLFTFASPFSIEVWLLLGVAYFFVSFSLFIMGRLSPSEWTNPFPCIEEPEFLINQFSLRNCCWFTLGSLMQQGSEIAPIAISTRLAAGAWWFFTLIMVSSYTANLAAFLTVETLISPFSKIEELAQQSEIRYGAKAGGATYNFFRHSNYSVYPIVKDYMNRHPEDMTIDNDQGLKKVETENYAFLMESTSIEYIIERHCSLAQIGGLLDEKGYGIAMRKNSKYRNILSQAVLRLQERGILTVLKIKWWKLERGGGRCESRTPAATPLDLQNLGGVFFVMVVGTVLGFFGTFLEMALHVLKVSYKRKVPFKAEYGEELRFFMKFRGRTKATRINGPPDPEEEDDDNGMKINENTY